MDSKLSSSDEHYDKIRTWDTGIRINLGPLKTL